MKRITRKLILVKIPYWCISVIFRLGVLVKLPFQQFPVHRQGCIDKQPVFILGCGRSGNTLLRSMLIAGKEIAIPPESYVLPKVIRIFNNYNFLPWSQLTSMIIGEFQSYKEFYTWGTDLTKVSKKVRELPKDKRTLANILDMIYDEYAFQAGFKNCRWGDKTPNNAIYANRIAKVFPNASYIHIIRDPRAVASSYVNAGLFEDHESGAKFWLAANKQIEKISTTVKIKKVFYESLVNETEVVLRGVCDFISIMFCDKMLHPEENFSILGDVMHHEHHKNSSQPISAEHINKWKYMISPADKSMVENIVSKQLQFYHYEKGQS